MLPLRRMASFCKMKFYVQRFQQLQQKVNNLQKQYVTKKEEVQKIKDLNSQTDQEKLLKILTFFSSSPYESERVKQQIQKLKDLQKKKNILAEEAESRLKISNKLTTQEKAFRQKKFVTDLAKFTQSYEKTVNNNKFDQDLRFGLENSVKVLSNVLQKEGVQWLGKENQKFDPQIHQKIDGDGQNVKIVKQRGFRVKGTLISKSKVQV